MGHYCHQQGIPRHGNIPEDERISFNIGDILKFFVKAWDISVCKRENPLLDWINKTSNLKNTQTLLRGICCPAYFSAGRGSAPPSLLLKSPDRIGSTDSDLPPKPRSWLDTLLGPSNFTSRLVLVSCYSESVI